MDRWYTRIMAYLFKKTSKLHIHILFAFITLGYQTPVESDHTELAAYQSLKCHKHDESQMRHICNRHS